MQTYKTTHTHTERDKRLFHFLTHTHIHTHLHHHLTITVHTSKVNTPTLGQWQCLTDFWLMYYNFSSVCRGGLFQPGSPGTKMRGKRKKDRRRRDNLKSHPSPLSVKKKKMQALPWFPPSPSHMRPVCFLNLYFPYLSHQDNVKHSNSSWLLWFYTTGLTKFVLTTLLLDATGFCLCMLLGSANKLW